MRLVTGNRWGSFSDVILFPEYGKSRDELLEFVGSLKGDETIVTASLELVDLITQRFKREKENVLIYSNTGKSLTLKKVYELRKYLDFDVRGGFSGHRARTSVLFVEGKTDAKFFKAVFKKLFEFRESGKALYDLRFIERVFERDNFELLAREGQHLAVIPSEGKSGVIRNLGNFLKAMEVFNFRVERIGVAIDIDESGESTLSLITEKLSSLDAEKTSLGHCVGGIEAIPLIIGLPFEDELIAWKKPTIEDFMLHLMEREGLLEKVRAGLRALNESLGRKLKPKEVMYLALSAYGYWGNLEGFYELFVMRSHFRNLKAILREAGLMNGLRYLAWAEKHNDLIR